MKIKKLKYILGLSFSILFFVGNIVFGNNGCINGMTSGTDVRNLSRCKGTGFEYDNTIPLSEFGANAQLFFKMNNIVRVPCVAGSESSSEDLVRGIQRKMQAVGDNCSSCIDGKVGNVTKTNLNNCPAKACPDPYMVPKLEDNTLTCENENYEIKNVGIDGAYCCKEKEEPEITISQPKFNPQENWDFESDIYVYFSIGGTGLTQNNLDCDISKFSVDGGSIQDVTADQVENGSDEAGCVLHILTDNNSVTVSVSAGVVQIGNNQSSAGNNTFTRENPETEPENPACDKAPHDGNDCTSYGVSYTYSSEENCCVTTCDHPQNPGGTCENGFTPNGTCCDPECSNPPNGDGICASGYQNNGAGCCESRCSGDKVYDPSIDNCTGCAEGTIANPDNTKCICDSSVKCCGIKLNTVVPFIGDCIELDSDSTRSDTTSVNSVTAFPILMQGLMKIVMSVIMVFSFIMLIVAGLMMTAGAFKNTSFDKGKTILKNVIISLILLGCSGLILSLINPSFFGG